MNTVPIRIKPESQEQLDILMKQYTINLFNEGKEKDKIRKITKKGLSYGDFVDELIDSYRKHQ